MNSCSKRFLVLLIGAACLGALPAVGATDEGPPIRHLLQFRDQVVVDSDGNGALAATFPTTVAGPEVRYVLYIDNAPGAGVSPPTVSHLAVSLNEEVVFQSDAEVPDPVRVEVALKAAGGGPNRILLTAHGVPGSAARVTVLAVRPAVGRTVADTGIVSPGPGQLVRVTVASRSRDDVRVRVRRLDYIRGDCSQGVCALAIASQHMGDLMTLAPGQGFTVDVPSTENARVMILSDSPDLRINGTIVDAVTGKAEGWVGVGVE